MPTSPHHFDSEQLQSDHVSQDHVRPDRVVPSGIERRAGQRFSYLLPVSFRETSTGIEGLGFTQDLSSRGVFLFTDTPLHQDFEIELTLNMPSEITLGDDMRVRCRGHILRIVKPGNPGRTEVPSQTSTTTNAPAEVQAETKIGVAVRLEGYEYLPDSNEASATFQRVSGLHNYHEEDRPLPAPTVARPVIG
jgi:PilZ domain-containing protein